MFRMGILGVGKIAVNAMIPAFAHSTQTELCALATRSESKAEQLKKDFSVKKCYSSYESLLEDDAIDGVYIGLPNHLHKDWTIRCLEAKKHVLCDKPLTMNLEEAIEIQHAVDQSGNVMMEAFMYRFHPQHDCVREIMQSGELGRIRSLECRFHYFLEDDVNFRLRPEMGGGGLWDVGCYGIDSARYLLGAEPASCAGTWHLNDQGVDDFCFFTLHFPNGCVASVSCGMRQPGVDTYRVNGDLGSICVPHAYIPKSGCAAQVAVTTSESSKELSVPETNQYARELDAFAQASAGDVDCGRVGNGLRNMGTLCAVRRACQSGQVEKVREIALE